jgi:hypothetical protein
MSENIRPLFKSRAAFEEAKRAEIVANGIKPVRATYDTAGNCTICGEAGRCPGWHASKEVPLRVALSWLPDENVVSRSTREEG